MIDRDRRRHERVQIKRNVTVRNGAESHEGALVDISSSGAAISIEEDNYTIEEDQDAHSDENGHRFRRKAATCSDPKRPL